MKVLVSGGFGLIGSYLTPLLLARRWQVGVIVRRVPDSFAALSRRVHVHVHDVREGVPRGVAGDYDCFIHLAGSPHSHPTGDGIGAAVAATRNCIELCRRAGIRRFVHFSSFQVYGRDWGAIDAATPVNAVNEYGRGHAAAEEVVRQADRDAMLDHTILRPTNAYGCPEHPEVHRWSLVPDCFCESAVRDGEIVIRSSGLQYKDFIYLGRLAGLTYEVCRRFERFRGQAINLAGGTACTIRDVAAQVRDEYVALTGRPCVIRVLSDDPPAREPLVVAGPPTATLPVDPALESDLRTEIGKTLRYLTT